MLTEMRETGQYIVNNLENNLNVRKTKYIQCIDCGEWVEVDIKDSQTNRCKSCYTAYRKRYKAEKERNRRKCVQHNYYDFHPLYTDVFKIAKIETSDICGRRFVHYMETHRIRIYF